MRKLHRQWLGARLPASFKVIAAKASVVSDVLWSQISSVDARKPDETTALVFGNAVKLHVLATRLASPILASWCTTRVTSRHDSKHVSQTVASGNVHFIGCVEVFFMP